MNLSFEAQLAKTYTSSSQQIRVLSEHWVGKQAYCPNCGHVELNGLTNNKPVADFMCSSCSEEYELKSQKNRISDKIVDGAYRTMIERLMASSNPNLFLLTYQVPQLVISNFIIVPKHFFTPQIIQERKPLAATARRAGWVGCNILFRSIPNAGQIFLVKNGIVLPKSDVMAKWKRTLFLREQKDVAAKGWVLSVMKCVEKINKSVFSLEEVYSYEGELRDKYPGNRHIREKIRQQLQVLRDKGYLEFMGRGKYRWVEKAS